MSEKPPLSFTESEFQDFKLRIQRLARESFEAADRAGQFREWMREREELLKEAEGSGIDVHSCFAWHDAWGGTYGGITMLDLPGEFSLEAFYQRKLEEFQALEPDQGN